jgi:hypothetical protein
MKKTPAPVKPDAPTYFLAKRMENAGRLRPGQALMLAAALAATLPQNRGKSATAKKGKRK